MTTEQIYQKYNNEFHLEGNNGGIQKHKHYILKMMQDFGRLMCDKQKEICKNHAKTMCETGGFKTEDAVSIYSILSSPYPEELL